MKQESLITLQPERQREGERAERRRAREIESEKRWSGERDMRQLDRAATQISGSRIHELCLWRIPAIRPLLLTIHRIRHNHADVI